MSLTALVNKYLIIDDMKKAFEIISNCSKHQLCEPIPIFSDYTSPLLLYKLQCVLLEVEFDEDDDFTCDCCEQTFYTLNLSTYSTNDDSICNICAFYILNKSGLYGMEKVIKPSLIDSQKEADCPICFEKKYCYDTFEKCNHQVCLDCFIKMGPRYECMYRCGQTKDES